MRRSTLRVDYLRNRLLTLLRNVLYNTMLTDMETCYDGRGYEDGKKITWRDGITAVWTLVKFRLIV
jgi:hypothetical protein